MFGSSENSCSVQLNVWMSVSIYLQNFEWIQFMFSFTSCSLHISLLNSLHVHFTIHSTFTSHFTSKFTSCSLQISLYNSLHVHFMFTSHFTSQFTLCSFHFIPFKYLNELFIGLGSWSLHNLLPIHFYVHFIWKIILAFVFSSFSFHVHSH